MQDYPVRMVARVGLICALATAGVAMLSGCGTEDGADAGGGATNDTGAAVIADTSGGAPDAATADTATADTAASDAAAVDSLASDTSAPDTSVPDSSAPDTSTPDTSAPDTSTPDAATPDGSSPDTSTSGVVCTGKDPVFPAFSKGCTTASDCVAVEHQINCCGTHIALAIHKSGATGFAAAEKTCQQQYPKCGCATFPTMAEDGLYAPSLKDVVPVCEKGVCLATVPSSKGKCEVSGVKQPKPYKWCQSNKDCTYMLHQLDCCGSQAAWGVTKTSKPLIEPAEATCAALFPKCKCMTKPVTTEDGDNASSGLIAVRCEQGFCQTYIK